MAENMYIQLAQNNAENTQTYATTQTVNNSRDWHDTIGEGLKVKSYCHWYWCCICSTCYYDNIY